MKGFKEGFVTDVLFSYEFLKEWILVVILREYFDVSLFRLWDLGDFLKWFLHAKFEF